MYNREYENIPPNRLLKEIRKAGEEIDQLLAAGKITEWESWECYFCLMFECNLAAINFESRKETFFEERDRFAGKINREKFNPFHSKNIAVIMIARAILFYQGQNTNLDN